MRKSWIASIALLAGGALAGGILAGSLDANAATASSSASSAPAPGTPPHGMPAGGALSGGHGPGETVVTGAKASQLKAAALEAVPGATVDRVETDSGDAAYEVHLTKSDGTQVTVKFDSGLQETGVESGMGR